MYQNILDSILAPTAAEYWDGQSFQRIRLLACLAALFHDFGKANRAHQKKVHQNLWNADAYRHEWVSLRAFAAFVGNDDDPAWLRRLVGTEHPAIRSFVRDGLDDKPPPPLASLPPLAQAVGWLILTHHRLPSDPDDGAPLDTRRLVGIQNHLNASWCGARPLPAHPDKRDRQAREVCWQFSHGLPLTSRHWVRRASRVAAAVLARPALLAAAWLDDPYVLHQARLVLIMADHYYSSQPSDARYGDPGYPLYANTDAAGKPKQRLDEHLVGLEITASRIARSLPKIATQLPGLSHHRNFLEPTDDPRFRWQDRAFDCARSLSLTAERQGFFGVNMASTGTGKTLANGRILYGLSHPSKARFTIAVGLRTLTLQTGDAYRDRLHLGADQMAVLVGGIAVRELHDHHRALDGCAPIEDTLTDPVLFEGCLADGSITRWLPHNPDAQRFLNAPIAICTIDHLMPATEAMRGGRQIVPMLRLMTADLVLDEPDDFDIQDLHALTRLVHWVGLLGSRLLLSSATLPPSLVQGLFEAYRQGRLRYQRHRGELDQDAGICCAWFDEFGTASGNHNTPEAFAAAHHAVVDRRLSALAATERRRHAIIKDLPILPRQSREAVCQALAGYLREHVTELHAAHHRQDPATGQRVSFGLIRMANINPLVLTAQALYALGAPVGHRIHLCVYHANHPLLIRSAIERRLDLVLNRKDEDAIFRDPAIRELLRRDPEQHHVFVVLATAVAEVGRDHDYDWASVEPSSMRSIIQLSGRVRRHRSGVCASPNVYLWDQNIRLLEHGDGGPCFFWPGFEAPAFPLDSHRLTDLLTDEQLAVIDASSRIRERLQPNPKGNLVDLEHARLRALMLGAEQRVNPVSLWWTTHAALTGELQRRYPFREDRRGRQRCGLIPDGQDRFAFVRFGADGATAAASELKHDIALDKPAAHPITFWGTPDYGAALAALADSRRMSLEDCARRYGVVDLPNFEQGWAYHPALGFSRYQ